MLKKTKKKLKTLCMMAALPLALTGSMLVIPSTNASAEENSVFINDYSEQVSVNNNSFAGISGTYATGHNFTGWSAIDTSSSASGMIIDVGSSFSTYRNTYYLNGNPNKSGKDDKILMINSKSSSSDSAKFEKQGYKSNEITLEANSYYKFSVDALTTLDGSTTGEHSAYASIYISGLRDMENKPVEMSYENVNNLSWKTYYFFIATGSNAQTVTLDLYLGSETTRSSGVVFFDEVYLEKYAPSTFYNTTLSYGYNFLDNNDGNDNTAKAKFLVSGLQNKKSTLNMDGYNFDFEAPITSLNTLGEEWEKLPEASSVNGYAQIMPVHRNVQSQYFKEQTGYDFVGNDLSFNFNTRKENQQALVLFTTSPSAVAVQSKDFEIKAHGLYKISFKAKISQIKSGDFNITVKENDTIYSKYEISKDNYTTKEYTKTGSKSNETNNFTNNYTTFDIYVKGHDYYDTNVNLIFSLGNKESNAEGCVIIDNIEISYVDYETISAATDKLEFSAYTESPTFTNGYFNVTENEEAELAYPLKAKDWASTKQENSKQESGVIYLKDAETYENMYKDYNWKSSYPRHPNGTDSPNNMYMLYNPTPSYQSVKSSAYSLGANDYHKLTFDYKTLSTSTAKNATFTLEIEDGNGITLFRESGFSANDWGYGKMEVYFHTGVSMPANIAVNVKFGEKDDEMMGYLYLDNFEVSSGISQAVYENADYTVDLTDYLLNLDPKGTIGYNLSESQAYKLSIDDNYSSSVDKATIGGIVTGKENEFGITVEDSNILVLSSAARSKSTLTSNYTFNIEENKYYKLTFDLRTIFNVDEDAIKANKEHECKYGVSVGLSGFNLASELKSNDDFTKYAIIFKATSSSTPNFTFTLDCDCNETLGSAYLTHIEFAEANENDYTSAKDNENFNKTLFTSTELQAKPEEPDDDKEDNVPTTNENNELWLIIPSVIFAAALLIAIIGFSLRRVKIKKHEKLEKETYDKKINVNHDLILIKAQAERDKEAEEIRNSIKAVIESRENLIKQHKEDVRAARANANGKISKETEKEFKAYAGKIARLEEKENILKEQLDTTLSADHLIEIENRLADEEQKMLREMEKLQAGKTKQKDDNSDKNMK